MVIFRLRVSKLEIGSSNTIILFSILGNIPNLAKKNDNDKELLSPSLNVLDKEYYYVECTRSGRKRLAMKTFYKTKTAPEDAVP